MTDKNNNEIIILYPRLEGWILHTARLAKVDVRDYNLPRHNKKLHDVINTKLDKWGKLIHDLSSHFRLMTLKECHKY